MSNSKFPYIARGNQRYAAFRSVTFNVDNGSGTTADDVIFSNLPSDAEIVEVKAVYVEATDTAGAASANFKLGTTAGGTGIVAATALEVSKAVGATTSATLASSKIPAGGTLFVRHTGVATTQPGQYYVQVLAMLKP
jgi:hypothetical protein